MLLTILILLAVAALGGITMVILRLRGRLIPPTSLAIGHGVIAASGLLLLLREALVVGLPQLGLVALGIFVLAAIGGLSMFILFHLRNKPLPLFFMIGHGSIAIIGYICLAIVSCP